LVKWQGHSPLFGVRTAELSKNLENCQCHNTLTIFNELLLNLENCQRIMTLGSMKNVLPTSVGFYTLEPIHGGFFFFFSPPPPREILACWVSHQLKKSAAIDS